MLNKLLSKILEILYKYDSLRAVKDFLRPLKHFIFGKNDIYYVAEQIKKARGDLYPIKVIFDVGAAVGDKTLTFLKEFPNSTIYCFEPQGISFSRLKKRTKSRKNRLLYFNYGLYNKNCKMQLLIYSYRDASSLLPMQNYMKKESRNEVGKERIIVHKLDDVCGELNISRIDLIKIDVEGVEKEMLEGSINMLKKTDNVYVEISPLRKGVHSRDYIDVFNILHEAGFTFMGEYGDYWFSKDEAVLKNYFE